jgi:DNA-binding transcriptional regulator YdaS (Cro superfamily)
MTESPAMERAIQIAGSEAKLAVLIGCSQVAVNKAKRRGKCSAEMAVEIDRALKGAVTKLELRPDLFSSPSHEDAQEEVGL